MFVMLEGSSFVQFIDFQSGLEFDSFSGYKHISVFSANFPLEVKA
jgi:hypothetical protein